MKRILVVDDTKNIRLLLTTCLELNGYSVIAVNNAAAAIEIFNTENIDLVFLDIKMPEISGTELLKKMRGMGLSMPVVIMTAFGTIKNAIDCTRLGAVAYLQKPFTAEKVKSVLEDLDYRENSASHTLSQMLCLCRELITNDHLDDAFQLLKKALSENPSQAEIYYLLSLVYDKKGDKKQAAIFSNMAEQFKK